jgi:prepilin-type N-terminal cleavage/methylation domain-containing protein
MNQLPASSFQLPAKCRRRISLAPGTRQLAADPRGFTLVEMIVSVALFSVVMLVCVGALLALVGANKKVHALQSVMNNLNVTLDSMVRNIRMGSTYDGSGDCSTFDASHPKDCIGGGKEFSFVPYCTQGSCPPPATLYKYDPDGSICPESASDTGKAICRSVGGGSWERITSPEVSIDDMKFYVVGSTRGCSVNPCDLTQPKVVVVIRGTAPVLNSVARTSFHIQVTAVQRLLDL